MDYQKNMQKNLRYLLSVSQKNQHDFAMQFHLSDGSLSSYLNGKTAVPLDTLLRLQTYFHFSIDAFLTQDFEKLSLTEDNWQMLQRYAGLYTMYYFDPSIVGQTENIKDQLEYGLLYIQTISVPFAPDINQITGLFGFDQESLARYWNQYKDCPDLLRELAFEEGIYRYQGKMVFLNDIINFQLYSGEKDYILFSINQPRGLKPYIGGMGLCMSISRGSQRVPCMQYMASCRGLITASAAEIADHLRLGDKNVDLYLETKRLLRRIDDYFNPYAKDQDLDTDEKELLILHHLERIVKDTMETHVMRFEKANPQRDYQWYQWIKPFIEVK